MRGPPGPTRRRTGSNRPRAKPDHVVGVPKTSDTDALYSEADMTADTGFPVRWLPITIGG